MGAVQGPTRGDGCAGPGVASAAGTDAADDVARIGPTGQRRRSSPADASATVDTMGRRHANIPTAVGDLLVVAAQDDTGDAIVGVYFPDHRYPPAAGTTGEAVDWRGDPLLSQARAELAAYLARERTRFDLSLRTRGDAFNERVWAMLTAIPYGTTTTYGALATELGSRNLAQRVGQAVGHNPISILIPCHRVLGADGSLTGYAGGLARKRQLLDLEAPAAHDAGRLF